MSRKQWHRWLIQSTAEFVKINCIKGNFVECGVKQGTSSRIMAVVLQRDGYLFDTWEGFPHYSKKFDVPSRDRVRRLDKRVKDKTSSYKQCKQSLKKHGVFEHCHMVKGDICKTVPAFTAKHSIPVALLHIDTDLHNPAHISLKYFYDKVVNGGIVVFHDYADPKWPGIKRVVDEFVNKMQWGFIDMGRILNVYAAVVINGDSHSYERYIKMRYKDVINKRA